MLSVKEAAALLDISPNRIRKLIADDLLPAEKIGNAWALDEAAVMQRLSVKPKAGRPRRETISESSARKGNRASSNHAGHAHKLFLDCKELLGAIPDDYLLASARSAEEASFYIAVSDFFLQQRQRKLVEQGVF